MEQKFKKRRMKVYYGHSKATYERHPVIRLGGRYLEKVNFKIGDNIKITIEEERIVITKLPTAIGQ